MESVAYDEITLDDIAFEDDLYINLEPDEDVEAVSFEEPDDDIDLEPDSELDAISFEDWKEGSHDTT